MFPDLTRDDVFRLETRRLWLRWARQADAQALVRLAGEKAVAGMTARIPHPLDPPSVDKFILDSRQANADGRALVMAITPRRHPTQAIGIRKVGGGTIRAKLVDIQQLFGDILRYTTT